MLESKPVGKARKATERQDNRPVLVRMRTVAFAGMRVSKIIKMLSLKRKNKCKIYTVSVPGEGGFKWPARFKNCRRQMDFVQISIGEKQKEMLQCGFPLVKKQGNRLPKISCNQMVTGAF